MTIVDTGQKPSTNAVISPFPVTGHFSQKTSAEWLLVFISLRCFVAQQPAYGYIVSNKFFAIVELNFVPFYLVSLSFYPCYKRLLL